jgi:predicted dehydrogenase
MERLNVGIIGAGMALERLHYPAYQELSDKYQIVAVCDEDKFKAQQWAKKLGLTDRDVYSDYQEMANRPDLNLVDIMVPIGQNFVIAEAVASIIGGMKKGIILEKPLAPTLEQAEKCASLPRKYDVMMMIAENYRYNEDPNRIRELVNRGEVGDVDYFLWNRVLNYPEDMVKDTFLAKEWRQHPDFSGGIFYDTAVHDIAAIRHVFGPIDELMAYGQQKPVTPNQYTVVHVVFRFKSGFTGSYIFYSGGKEIQRPLVGWRIIGRKGMIYQEERDCGTINVYYNDGSSKQIPYRPQRGYYNELLNFYNAFVGQEPLSVTPELELGDARTILAILESMEQETPVRVDEGDSPVPHYDPARLNQYLEH